MRKTKIICTIGPASESSEVLCELIESGMNAARLNFSHGTHEEHGARIDKVKELREKSNKPVAIILDTKGPEIRTGNFENTKVDLTEGREFTIVCGEEILGNESICSVTYEKLYEDVKSGDTILIDDGLVGLSVNSIEGNRIHCIVKNSGTIGNHKGVNVPGASISLPAITEKDISDLRFGIENEVDIVAASFIRKAADVLAIRRVLDENGGGDILIYSKIENQEGVNNLDEILKFSDGIMVARGDLGVEIPTEEVPMVQKMIIEKCNLIGKPVITATQMLDSMIRNPRPTRAEASDVANAILDGTDAIMLSGETASGKYPIEAVKTMARIAERSEKAINYEVHLKKMKKGRDINIPNALSLATCNTAMELNAAAIITPTQTGKTPTLVSKFRPECPIIAITPYENVARKLSLHWGVFPHVAQKKETTDELIDSSVYMALQEGYVKKGDLVIIAAGIPANAAGTTNLMKVHIVGHILVRGKGLGRMPGIGTANVITNIKRCDEGFNHGEILVVKYLSKEFMPLLDKAAGVITEERMASSEIASECIRREIPLIYNAVGAVENIDTGNIITMDVSRGIVFSGKTNVV